MLSFIPLAFAQENERSNAITNSQEGVSQFFADFLAAIPLWFAAGVVFFVSILLAKIIKKFVVHKVNAQSGYTMHQEVTMLIERVVHVGIVLLGALIAFKIVGIDISAIIGFLGIGIGFAFKDLLANFIAGVVILTQHKFKIGDVVRVKDQLGTVVEIETRTTLIKGFDGIMMIIPNSEMLTNVVENLSTSDFRRFEFNVGVHYDTNLPQAVDITYQSLKKHEKIIWEPAPKVVATEFADSAISLNVKFWIENGGDWQGIRSEVIQQLKKDFDEANIEIPFPIRTLALESGDDNIMEALHLPKKEKQGTSSPYEYKAKISVTTSEAKATPSPEDKEAPVVVKTSAQVQTPPAPQEPTSASPVTAVAPQKTEAPANSESDIEFSFEETAEEGKSA